MTPSPENVVEKQVIRGCTIFVYNASEYIEVIAPDLSYTDVGDILKRAMPLTLTGYRLLSVISIELCKGESTVKL